MYYFDIFTKMIKRQIVLATILVLAIPLFPQSTDKDFAIQAKAHYGFIIPHRSGMKNLIKGHVPGFEINYDHPTFGEKAWQQVYNYPHWGLSFYYTNLANPEELGIATGIYPYLSFPVILKKRFEFDFRMGWGVGYLSKTFDRLENHKNTVIGSRINAIIGLQIEAKWKISQHLTYATGIAFTHFSNGAYKVPNLGFNVPSLNTGISYSIGESDKTLIKDSMPPVKKQFEATFVVAGGLKEIYPAQGKKYGACVITADLARVLSRKSKMGAGLDLYYNPSLLERLSSDTSEVENKLSILQPGINIAYQIKFTKVSLVLSMGYYLHTKFKKDGYIYDRIGMRYRINDRLLASLMLKTHFFRADFIEFGIGYKINKY